MGIPCAVCSEQNLKNVFTSDKGCENKKMNISKAHCMSGPLRCFKRIHPAATQCHIIQVSINTSCKTVKS